MVELSDIEMKEADPSSGLQTAGTTTTTSKDDKKDADTLTLDDIKEQVRTIEKAVNSKEPRFILRVLRGLASTRKRLNEDVIRRLILFYYGSNSSEREILLGFAQSVSQPMDVDMEKTVSSPAPATNEKQSVSRPQTSRARAASLPEVDLYIHLIVLLFLIDRNSLKSALDCAKRLVDKTSVLNRRTLDLLSAKCYFYYARIFELNNMLDSIRPFLHSRLRTATLRNDFEGTAVLINLLLRNYLHYNLYSQAQKLVLKSVFPDHASNNEWARYLYYLGRIRAMQLEYTKAHQHLLTATRKAPQQTAIGFRQNAHKFLITVELLLGDIPDKATFKNPQLKRSLDPYYQLTLAVRAGDLSRFKEVLDTFSERFQQEKTWSLIIRLRHNVIKAGIKMISLSYARISFSDVAQKLQLDSPEDAEYIVAKAIRDGVIEASIDHEQGYVQSREITDVYTTREPMNAFHQRIEFCLKVHNESVKAMRYPPKKYNEDLETAQERREREQEELEYAKEMADDEDDF
ncbi:unnamed protein product [Rotaria magnacalcarata]|uniref:26S proteasome regulatory subunit RPN3 n=2 Tax=Rotaria magnacalcarata TaxID=392030 RepID=A0A819ELW9_9BILA|nr:unnamed protein product [Rotaria magnacalcarata]CAF1447097.1 unnamed protein product [Rotaria magnacalcarata]CAF1962948.1 unnamed protein product [Rotaria magnacalcarata]CAF2047103.1 unnamed protein product [Rotaria magnacalcarata]CAF2084179.1 unnamed protein product [Rotaria magnacalcarata]